MMMERTGAVERCPPGVTPRLMLPLGVAENSTELRVVYDARVLNQFEAPGDMGYPSLRTWRLGLRGPGYPRSAPDVQT